MTTALFMIVFAVGCGDDEPATVSPPPVVEATEDDPPPDPEDDDPLAGLDEPPSDAEYAGPLPTGEVAAPETIEAAVPERGCVATLAEPIRVWPTEAVVRIAAAGQGFVVAGYTESEAGGEDLVLLGVAPGVAPRPLRTVSINPPQRGGRVAPPAVAPVGPDRVAVAAVDGGGAVRFGEITLSSPSARMSLQRVGGDADNRFSPALRAFERHRVVAWTQGGTPMRVRYARLTPDGEVADNGDLTPPTMGASAPTFAAGGTGLYFVDARAGVSPIINVPFSSDGTPGSFSVARPVGTVTTPPRLSVARVGGSRWAAYTAVGNMAATAVGLVPIHGDDATPTALIPGTGYGELNVDAASGGSRRVLFAADSPKGTPPESPREIKLFVVDELGMGEPLTIAGPDGTAEGVTVARRRDGSVGVAFRSGGAVFVMFARCDL